MPDTSHQPKSIDVNEDAITIGWNDNHVSSLSAFELRCLCPCAHCVHELTGEKLLDPKKIRSDIKLIAAEPTGHYALSLGFSDAHATGIYSYEFLRINCPCQKCRV